MMIDSNFDRFSSPSNQITHVKVLSTRTKSNIVPLNEFFTKGLEGLHAVFAELGNMYSQFILGRAHFQGILSKNLVLAEMLLTQAVIQQYSEAIYLRSKLYAEIAENSDNLDMEQKSSDDLNDAALKDHPYAQYDWAVKAIRNSKYSPEKFSSAIECLTSAVENGHHEARPFLEEVKLMDDMYKRLTSLRTGSRDPQDLATREKDVFGWIEQLAVAGNGMAQYYLGFLYKNGIGTKRNLDKAFYFFKKASNKGVAEALLELTGCYKYGHGTKVDKHEAANCMRLAAKAGLADALWLLAAGKSLADSTEGRKNRLAMLTKAFDQHHPDAIIEMGHCYLYGYDNLPKDPLKALIYFRMANGETAQYQLGNRYVYGLGVLANIQFAFHFFRGRTDEYNDSLNRMRSIGWHDPGVCIANYYFEGKDGSQNIDRAWLLYKQAANLKDPAGFWGVGVCDPLRTKSSLSMRECLDYVVLANSQDLPQASITLGDYHLDGLCVQRDLAVAKKLYEIFLKCAAKPWNWAFEKRKMELVCHTEKKLAHIYNLGMPRIPKKTIELYSRHSEAQQKHKPSYRPLAGLYEKGIGTAKNPERAAYWDVKAKEGRVPNQNPTSSKIKKAAPSPISRDAGDAIPNAAPTEDEPADPFGPIKALLSVKNGIEVETVNDGKRLCIKVILQEKGSQRILEKIQTCFKDLTKQKKSITVKIENPHLLILTSTSTAGALDLFKMTILDNSLKRLKEKLSQEQKEEEIQKQDDKNVANRGMQQLLPQTPCLQESQVPTTPLTEEQVSVLRKQLKKFSPHIELASHGNEVIIDFGECVGPCIESYNLEVMGMRKFTNQPEAIFEVPLGIFKEEVVMRLVKLIQGKKGKKPELKDHRIIMNCSEVPDDEELNKVKDELIARLHLLKCKLAKKPALAGSLFPGDATTALPIELDEKAGEGKESHDEESIPNMTMLTASTTTFSPSPPKALKKNNENEKQIDAVVVFLENFLGIREMSWLTHNPKKNKKHSYSFDPKQVKTLSISGKHVDPSDFFEWLAATPIKGTHPFKFYTLTSELVISTEDLQKLSDPLLKSESRAAFEQWFDKNSSTPPYLDDDANDYQIYTKEVDPVEVNGKPLRLRYKFPLPTRNESLRFHSGFLQPYLSKSKNEIAEAEFRELQMHTMRFVHLFRKRYPRDSVFLNNLRATFRHNPQANWDTGDLDIFKHIILYGFHFLSYNATQNTYEVFEQLVQRFNKNNAETMDGLKENPQLLQEFIAAEELRLQNFVESGQQKAALSSAAAIGELILNDKYEARKKIERKGIKQSKLASYEILCIKIRREVGHETYIGNEYNSFNVWAAEQYGELKTHFA